MANPPRGILISAGEPSGDHYAGELARLLRARWPECVFFGCAGPKMRAAGVDAVVRTEDLSVVGLLEVVEHLPRIWGKFQQLVAAARSRKPDLAILTDAPDFHFRLAAKLKKQGVPVVWLVAPQVWAWRQGRVKTMRKVIDRLLCIFPFERAFFETHSVPVAYIGHPLAGRIKPGISREEFFRKHKIALDRPLVAVLPGSRKGEALRHLPALKDAAVALSKDRKVSFILPASPACGAAFFLIPLADSPIRAIDGEAWEAMAFCDVALAASGTVTVEAALLGTPMVTFYKVTDLSWKLGKYLVKVPFYTMVNLVAGRKVVPELMQAEMTGERLALETARLLDSEEERGKMKKDLAEVAGSLSLAGDAMARAADEVARLLGVPVLEGSKS